MALWVASVKPIYMSQVARQRREQRASRRELTTRLTLRERLALIDALRACQPLPSAHQTATERFR